MPGKLRRNDYDLVEEAYDNKSPVHNEDAFEHGITFKVKYIGTKDIHKPGSRAEIVSSMRRIRYEHKVYGCKKEKTELTVAVTGIRVVHREDGKRNWITQNKKKQNCAGTEVMHYPINRIFYVSHDSQDLQIFSFISKEDEVFRCSVFKALNKADAIHVVRTVGQAFEVCHKKTLSQTTEDNVDADKNNPGLDVPVKNNGAPLETDVTSPSTKMDFSTDMTMYHPDPSIAPLTIQQLRNIYQQQLDHQRQETQAAQAQVTLLTQQLDNETASRQLLHNQLDQVLKQNKDLITTITQLVDQVQTLQNQMRGRGDSGVSLSLDLDGGKISSGTALYSQDSSSVASSPSKEAILSAAALAKRRILGEPVFPHIPPPAVTPSPVMSHRSEIDALDGSVSSLQSSSKVASAESFLRSGTLPESGPLPPLVDLSSSDLEMVEPRHEPFPQQFLQFVFDSSDPTKGNAASSAGLAQPSGVVGTTNSSLPQTNSGVSAVVNGNS